MNLSGREPLVALLVASPVLNYLANVMVVGVPAVRMGLSLQTVARDLAILTLQIIASTIPVAYIGGLLLGDAVVRAQGYDGGTRFISTLVLGLAFGLLLQGATVGLLVRRNWRKRWGKTGSIAVASACAASVFSNPVVPVVLLMMERHWVP